MQDGADSAEEVGYRTLPCPKTLRMWASSRFEEWRLHSEQSKPFTWQMGNSKFSVSQIVAWFAFKDEKFNEVLQSRGPDSGIDRVTFGCNKMFHKHPSFCAIFEKPPEEVGRKRKRLNNEL
jgi:hypothetical protein